MPKNICIIHDSFRYFGGAERVLLALVDLYPSADIFIPIIDKKFLVQIQKKSNGKLFTATFLNNLGVPVRQLSILKPFIYLYWKTLDLSKYQLVISSSHSFSAKSVRVSKKSKHVCYLHTPPRYLYAEFNEMVWLKKSPWKQLLYPMTTLARKLDFRDAQKIDSIIVNSKNVQKRVQRYYSRESTVIYPPVTIPKILEKRASKYFLCISRLVQQKGVDLAIAACNKLHVDLVIVGVGPELAKLQKLAGPTITFVGFVPDAKLAKYYKEATALLYCSKDEDLGLVPLEAQAHGVPVIAYKNGGVLETVLENKTGIFFSSFSVDSMVRAMRKFERSTFSSTTCREYVLTFDRKIFRYKMRQHINKLLEKPS
ncbi:MAG: glycosyltransferase [bacterium]|nr:glycosyltransferase [bacterium]